MRIIDKGKWEKRNAGREEIIKDGKKGRYAKRNKENRGKTSNECKYLNKTYYLYSITLILVYYY